MGTTLSASVAAVALALVAVTSAACSSEHDLADEDDAAIDERLPELDAARSDPDPTLPEPVEDAGAADAPSDGPGAPTPSTKTYRLPWSKGTSMRLTQDCDDSCCSDHVGNDEYAYDWANGSSFLVRAARAGTITHLKINSTKGCATTACSTDVNMIVVDHGDGSQAIYMHVAGNTAAPGVTCGAKVVQGQPLAMAGTTGHSTGIHIHFQVSQVHKTAPTCECGSDGKHCATTFNPFPNVWVNGPYHTLPIAFDEWPSASTCKNRRITMPGALSQ
jgi:murein DD-endopeptidase MepM/ murein hydrolase activator NlpD